jgi:hypothetical protein
VNVDGLELSERGSELRLSLRVKPRASRSALVGVVEGALAVAVAAPPVDGAANDEVCTLVARALGVPRRAVSVVAGATGRTKVVAIDGLGRTDALARLEAFDPSSRAKR